jgi:hypothetical protein
MVSLASSIEDGRSVPDLPYKSAVMDGRIIIKTISEVDCRAGLVETCQKTIVNTS